MICEDCGRCQSIREKGEVYEIGCLEKGGFQLHSMHEDNFKCEDFVERPKQATPPKDNVFIVLKCGRDMSFYDKQIHCLNDIGEKLNQACRLDGRVNYVLFDNFQINVEEIACWGYLGE